MSAKSWLGSAHHVMGMSYKCWEIGAGHQGAMLHIHNKAESEDVMGPRQPMEGTDVQCCVLR